jgi:thiamine-phosphate pyrophosphorylase
MSVPRLYLITDRRLMPGGLAETVAAAVSAGGRHVQLRERDLCARELTAAARQILEATAQLGLELYINERADLAMAVGAHGVHLRGSSMEPEWVRRAFPGLSIGASVHSDEQARRAAEQGADFLLFGPVYDTPSKRAYGPPQGLDRLHSVVGAVSVPVLAVGGITPQRVAEVVARGARGVAAIRAAWESPGESVPEFLEALARAGAL